MEFFRIPDTDPLQFCSAEYFFLIILQVDRFLEDIPSGPAWTRKLRLALPGSHPQQTFQFIIRNFDLLKKVGYFKFDRHNSDLVNFPKLFCDDGWRLAAGDPRYFSQTYYYSTRMGGSFFFDYPANELLETTLRLFFIRNHWLTKL